MINLNIHPLFVHFPIALLVSYSILEFLPLQKYFVRTNWNSIRRLFLYLGTLATYPTVLTGLIAHKLIEETPLVEVHEKFALTTSLIFTIASILCLMEQFGTNPNKNKLIIYRRVLTVLGLIAIVVTGGLGGSIIYGTDFDPITSFVTKLFGVH